MCRRHWYMVPRPLRRAIRESWQARRIMDWRANVREAQRVVEEEEAHASG